MKAAGFLVLRKAIGVEILPGEAKEGEGGLVYFRLRHPKLPRGGIMFAMPLGHADAIADMIKTVIQGGGGVESATTIRGVAP